MPRRAKRLQKMVIYLEPSLHESLSRSAEKENISVSAMIRKLIIFQLIEEGEIDKTKLIYLASL